MSNDQPQTAEQGGEQSRLDRLAGDADPVVLGILGGVAVLGLIVNALAVSAFVGGGFSGIADGVLFLTPTTALAVVLFHRYDPVDMDILSPALLFVTIMGANTAALTIRTLRMGLGVGVGMSVIVLGAVALMFTPGPFLATYAARRWWV